MYPKSTVSELRLGVPKKMFTINVETGFDKQPVSSVNVNLFGIIGDHQVHSSHGGEDRALLQFDSRHYAELGKTFPNSRNYLVNGGFGENLVVAGMNEHNMCIGDKVAIGNMLLELSQPRPPCFKLNHRFNEPTMALYTQNNAKTGWFYRVLNEGIILAGDPIRVIERPHPEWPVARVQHYLYHETDNKAATTTLSEMNALGKEIRDTFRHRLESNKTEDWNGRLTGNSGKLEMRVVKIVNESEDIKRFYLSRTDLQPLPEFTAGANITLALPNGLQRSYSLCALQADDTWQIAVHKSNQSRGGSAFLHEQVNVGDIFTVSGPQNYFEMTRAEHQIFIAAGIGITPFLTMIEEALANSESFELHYCVKDINDYPFKKLLSRYSGKVLIYSQVKPLDIETLLNFHHRGTHVYSCGSPAFVDLVRKSAKHWSDEHVHFEHLTPPEKKLTENTAFKVIIKDTEQSIEVEQNESMLNALRKNGIPIDSSCETGCCGKCKVKYEGKADHRDTILTTKEKEIFMTPCVSRAKQERITVSIDK